ncbi:MAG TPA: pyridoxamine 5'-phosphate oxidase family protein [Microvirga sp.]|nr:pyridoxamine 5'-phosphate oxidase family protein [Microvirga sp.]
MVDQELAEFITSPVMMIIGTSDDRNRPEVGRCVGSRVLPRASGVEVIVSAWQWRRTVENLLANGKAAVTFVRPSDYACYQIKGLASVRDTTPEDVELSQAYIAAVTAALEEQGVAPAMSAVWLTNREAVVAQLSVETVSIKTPGPRAGAVLRADRGIAAP